MNGYKVIEGRVYKVNADAKKSEKIFCGNDIDIGGFENNVDQDIYYIWLKFRDEIHDKEVSIKMEREKINANTLTREIRKRGGVIVEGKSMLEYFLQKESDLLGIFRGYALKGGQHAVAMAGDKFEKMMQKTSTRDLSKSSREVKNCHTHIGWQTTEGNIVFRANRSISLDEAVEESEYDGRFRIEPQGSFDTVKNLFAKFVKDNIPLQVIAAIATAATFLGYADVKWKMVIPNMVFSLNSKTSVGKSTAIEFAASFGGFPDSKEDGAMCMDFEGTANAMLKKLGCNVGFPVGIDDTMLADSALRKNFSPFLYALSKGSEKERLNRTGDGFQENRAQFKTAILINGERSVFDLVDDIGGLTVRILEFSDVYWTKDAESSEAIKSIIRENYGHLTPRIAERILQISANGEDEKWKDNYALWKKKFLDESKIQGVYMAYTDRVVMILSLLMISIELLSEVVEMDFDSEQIFLFLFEKILVKLADDTNLGRRGYDWIVGYWKENYTKFLVVDKYLNNDSNNGICVDFPRCQGVIAPIKSCKIVDEVKYDRALYLPEKIAEDILNKGGFENVKRTMEAIENLKMLMAHNPNTGNCINYFSVNGEKMRGYKILIETNKK